MLKNFEDVNIELKKFIGVNKLSGSYSLNRMKSLMDFLDNPQNKIKIIHVAGTSGKTSTCYYIASLLHTAGYKVGLTISPHIQEVNERVQIDMHPLSESDYCSELFKFLEIINNIDIAPSYFEVLIAFAYWVFYKNNVDYAVVEVGLGGLLDATNVVNSSNKICVITDIGLDHTDILGKTIPEITEQKAGIIKPSNIVFINNQSEEIMNVIRRYVEKNSSSLTVVKNYPQELNTVRLPAFQKRNFRLAYEVVSHILTISERASLTIKDLVEASGVHIPGRMETFAGDNRILILDGSHNDQKIKAFVEACLIGYPGFSRSLLISFGENKTDTLSSSLKHLSRLTDSVIVTAFTEGQDDFRKAISPELLAEMCKKSGFKEVVIEREPQKAVENFFKQNSEQLIVTGSNYLLNDVRPSVLAYFSSKVKH